MMKFSISFLFFLLFNLSIKAQYLGQTKAYLIKQYETCKIVKNLDDYLLMDCEGIETLFVFDKNGLCTVHEIELYISDWNQLQITLIWNGATCPSKSVGPSPKNNNVKSDVIIYIHAGVDYFFYE